MEHASGADHLTFGWFFFALVLILLFITGEIIRTKADRAGMPQNESEPVETHKEWSTFAYKRPVAVASAALVLVFGWQLLILFGKQGDAGHY